MGIWDSCFTKIPQEGEYNGVFREWNETKVTLEWIIVAKFASQLSSLHSSYFNAT